MRSLLKFGSVILLSCGCEITRAAAFDVVAEKLNVSADFYLDQTSLMPFKGYQNDMNVTLYFQYFEYNLIPLLRYGVTNYYYLNELQPVGNKSYTSDRRNAFGLGLDYKINTYLKFRFLYENIDNKLSTQNYNQDSYGVIYNQYFAFSYIEFNNYLESFLIPRVSSKTLDTYLKVQLLKSYYVSQKASASHIVFPFLQTKLKVNDDANFGVSGQNGSLGLGYKYYGVNNVKDSFAFLAEAHSVFFQSKDFNGDWLQILAAVQLWID